MANNEKAGPSSGSQSNGIAYRVPALPNLMNGSGADPKQRLPSFRNTRKPDDLSNLLGKDAATLLANKTKDAARKFMPKLAPKPKPQVKTPTSKKSEAKAELDEGKQKGKHEKKDGKRGNFRPRETIQTTGSVFDTNLQFEKKIRAPQTSSGAVQRVAKPTLSAADRGKQLKERKKQEECAENGDKKPLPKSSDEYVPSDEDDDITPLALPMKKSCKAERPVLGACDFDVKPKIKDESYFSERMDTSSIVADVKPTLGVDVPAPPGTDEEKQEDPSNIRPFWDALIKPNANPHDFFSVQFPDYIPVSEKMMRMRNLLAIEELQQKQEEKLMKENAEGGASALTENPVGAYKLSVKDIAEGMFCRFRLRRSGKAELLFPSGIAFPVILGCGIGFKQDVCVIETGEGDEAGKMTMLGSLRDKLICVPNFEDIVAKSFSAYDAPPVKVEMKPEKPF